MVRAVPVVGLVTTFCRGPETMIDGLIASEAPPEPSAVTSAVTTNCCRTPVLFLLSGCTLLRPMVNTSPFLRAPAWVPVQPLVTSAAPLCVAPLTTGEPPLVPTVCDGHRVFS